MTKTTAATANIVYVTTQQQAGMTSDLTSSHMRHESNTDSNTMASFNNSDVGALSISSVAKQFGDVGLK